MTQDQEARELELMYSIQGEREEQADAMGLLFFIAVIVAAFVITAL